MTRGSLLTKLEKLEQKITPKPLDVTVVLNFPTEELRAAAEARHRQYPEGVVKHIFKLSEATWHD